MVIEPGSELARRMTAAAGPGEPAGTAPGPGPGAPYLRDRGRATALGTVAPKRFAVREWLRQVAIRPPRPLTSHGHPGPGAGGVARGRGRWPGAGGLARGAGGCGPEAGAVARGEGGGGCAPGAEAVPRRQGQKAGARGPGPGPGSGGCAPGPRARLPASRRQEVVARVQGPGSEPHGPAAPGSDPRVPAPGLPCPGHATGAAPPVKEIPPLWDVRGASIDRREPEPIRSPCHRPACHPERPQRPSRACRR